ncbi:MAG: hypothetical protein ACYC6Y_31710 [Thermoguttaceae bacterium]
MPAGWGAMQKLKHSKSTIAEGISLLLWLGLTLIVAGCFQIYFFEPVWPRHRLLALGILAGEAAVALVVLGVAAAKIRRNETFVCILDDELIECVCPVKDRGDSFRIRLADLVRVERQLDGDSHRWYLHDRQGKRHWLTHAYRNPADRFVHRIHQILPDLPRTEPES